MRRLIPLAAVIALGLPGCGEEDHGSVPRDESDGTEVNDAERGDVKLASIRLQDGGRIRLVSSMDATGPCLELLGIDDQRRACGRAPSERVPPVTGTIIAEVIARASPSGPLETYGATSADVARVVVRYRTGCSRDKETAHLMHVSSERALERAGIDEPFGYYFGALPSDADHVSATALDGTGKRLGSASFDQLLNMPPGAFISGPE